MEKKNLTSFHGGIGLSNVASHGSKQGDAVLGGGDCVGGRSIDDKAAKLSGGLQINIVDPNAGPSNHLEPALRRLEDLARDLSPAPNDQRVEPRDLRAELLRRQVVGAIDVAESSEHLQSRLSELLGDEHSRLRKRNGAEIRGGGDGSVGGFKRLENAPDEKAIGIRRSRNGIRIPGGSEDGEAGRFERVFVRRGKGGSS